MKRENQNSITIFTSLGLDSGISEDLFHSFKGDTGALRFYLHNTMRGAPIEKLIHFLKMNESLNSGS